MFMGLAGPTKFLLSKRQRLWPLTPSVHGRIWMHKTLEILIAFGDCAFQTSPKIFHSAFHFNWKGWLVLSILSWMQLCIFPLTGTPVSFAFVTEVFSLCISVSKKCLFISWHLCSAWKFVSCDKSSSCTEETRCDLMLCNFSKTGFKLYWGWEGF